MKKIEQPKSKNYTVLRLYKDDLEKIETIFKDNYKDYKIIVDEYELDNISEISNIDEKETTNFSVSAYNPNISLDVYKDSAKLYISDEDDLKLLGMFYKIDDILSNRISPPTVFRKTWFWIQIPLGMGLGALLMFSITKGILLIEVLSVLSALLTLIGLLKSFEFVSRRHNLIYLFDPPPKSNFFKRNKDKIIVAIISAIIGAIMGIGGTIVANWLYNKFF